MQVFRKSCVGWVEVRNPTKAIVKFAIANQVPNPTFAIAIVQFTIANQVPNPTFAIAIVQFAIANISRAYFLDFVLDPAPTK